ncbi:MAG: hypothetical protein ACOY3H_02655 [Bacillota bacterium]
MNIKQKFLATFVAAVMAIGPVSAVMAEETTTTNTTTTQTTVTTDTYGNTTTTTTTSNTTQVNPFAQQVLQVKAVLAKLLDNPTDATIKAELNKMITGKKDIRVLAQAINSLKKDAVADFKKTKDRKTYVKRIHRINELARMLKKEIVKRENEIKKEQKKDKRELAQLKAQEKKLKQELKVKAKAEKAKRKIAELQAKIKKLEAELAAATSALNQTAQATTTVNVTMAQ